VGTCHPSESKACAGPSKTHLACGAWGGPVVQWRSSYFIVMVTGLVTLHNLKEKSRPQCHMFAPNKTQGNAAIKSSHVLSDA
jgi:hypothetical protein